MGHAMLWTQVPLVSPVYSISHRIIQRTSTAPISLHFKSMRPFDSFPKILQNSPNTLDRIHTICHIVDAEFILESPALPELRSLSVVVKASVPLRRYIQAFPKLSHLLLTESPPDMVQLGSIASQLSTLHLRSVLDPLDALETARDLPHLQEFSINTMDNGNAWHLVGDHSQSRQVDGKASRSLKRLRIVGIESRYIDIFLRILVHPNTFVTIESTHYPRQQIFGRAPPLDGGNSVWIEEGQFPHIFLICDSPSALIRLELQNSPYLFIPSIIRFQVIHTLYICKVSPFNTMSIDLLGGLTRLVVEFGLSFTASETDRFGPISTPELVQECPNLTQIVIILKERTLAVQSRPISRVSTTLSSSFISPMPTTFEEAEVYIDTNSERNAAGETHSGTGDGHNSSVEYLSEAISVASRSILSWRQCASGEQFDDEKKSKILPFSVEVLHGFLDMWLEVHGDRFSSLTIHDEIEPQRWQNLLPILSTKVQNIELGAPSLSATPPAFPEFHSFDPPRCTHCRTE